MNGGRASAAEPMPAHIPPMLARAGALPLEETGWAYEVKWDGIRALAYIAPGALRIEGRSLAEISDRYPELAGLADALDGARAVLDGEIVSLDAAGRPSFGALQRRIHVQSTAAAQRLARSEPVTYMIFDLLWLDGHSLMGRAYAKRRAALHELALEGPCWRTPPALAGRGRDVLEASRAHGLEGIVAKRLDAEYRPGGRDGAWIKLKHVNREELVIGGSTPGEGRRAGTIGALLLGAYDGAGQLHYAGRVGSGFRASDLDLLAERLRALRRADSPFAPGTPAPPRGSRFCEPALVAEVAFREWTADGQLRGASYKGLREDKPPQEVIRAASARTLPVEPVEPAEPREPLARRSAGGLTDRRAGLSNPEKVLYPAAAFTKRDVLNYYVAVAPAILPHLHGRPLTVKRFPDGVDGKAFFEKQSPAHRPPWVRTVAVASARTHARARGRGAPRASIDYTLVEDPATLAWLANLAALELHTPLARIPDLGRPSAIVFDLDPGAPATIIDCCRVALWLRAIFEQLALASFAKTSGSKGLQLYIPVAGELDYGATKRFAQSVARSVERAQPDLVVSRMTRALRAGKVLIDWSQNDEHKTTVCVYSLRAAERPTVSTPIAWEEVAAALDAENPAALAFLASEVRDRLERVGDLFAPVLSLPQAIPTI